MDLITTIGDPFPPHTHTNTSKDGEGNGERREERKEGGAGEGGGRGEGGGGRERWDGVEEVPEEADQEGGGGESGTDDESGHLIRVLMRPHEGVEERQPFRVEPSQMVNNTLSITHHCVQYLHYITIYRTIPLVHTYINNVICGVSNS